MVWPVKWIVTVGLVGDLEMKARQFTRSTLADEESPQRWYGGCDNGTRDFSKTPQDKWRPVICATQSEDGFLF